MSDMTTTGGLASRMPKSLRKLDPAVATAFACIIALLVFGSLYSTSFLSPEYLLQQLKVASFLGVIATGMMLVILLGQIDLSVPWTVATGAMMASAAAAFGPVGVTLAIPFGILCGALIGVVNGFGVAYLRIPSMIVTLATNAVAHGLRGLGCVAGEEHAAEGRQSPRDSKGDQDDPPCVDARQIGCPLPVADCVDRAAERGAG